jgi:branched-chain amino acid transport system ATP-binding protein
MAPIIRRQIWDGPATMKSAGQSILAVDKNTMVLARLADHHVILAKGQVVWQGGQRRALGRQGPDGAVSWRMIT